MSAAHVIVGTAGHVDHGKTALVKALTGIDTDTQPEEQARGVTIDVGFAYWQDRVTLIDVPGHERFVKNAVTGASAIDLALFVVAADDGVMPQTREHLAILQLLGIRRGVVALTKTDLVEPDWVDLVAEEVRELTAGTFLEDAPILPVSTVTGDGVDTVRAALEAAIAAVAERVDRGTFRLPVDRVFSVPGFGTVVTGTVLAGRVEPRDELVLQPQGRTVRVRGVQVHGHDRPEAGVGQRAAVNLSDLEVTQVRRGDTLAAPGHLSATYMIDAVLQVLDDAEVPVQHRDRVRLHLGPREALARVVLLDTDAVAPGQRGLVQFHLEDHAVAAHGDRFVVRRYSPARTLGGGTVLDPHPSRHRRRRPQVLAALRGLDTDNLEAAALTFLHLAGSDGLTAPQLAARLGLHRDRVQAILEGLVAAGRARAAAAGGTTRYLDEEIWTLVSQAVIEALDAYHRQAPLKAGLAREPLHQRAVPRCERAVYDAILQDLVETGRVVAQGSHLRLAEHRVDLPPDAEALRQRLQQALRQGGAAPPDTTALPNHVEAEAAAVTEVLEVMQARSEVLRLADGLVFDAGVLGDLETRLVAYLRQHGHIEVSAFRELAGTSRKYAVPLLNHFDARGVTRRDGAVRRLADASVTGDG